MFIKDEILGKIIKQVLLEEGVANADGVVQKIMNELVKWQTVVAQEGAKKGGRKKKDINLKVVQRQLDAKVPFTVIAASQHVSEGTLRRKLMEEGYNPRNDILRPQPKNSSSG